MFGLAPLLLIFPLLGAGINGFFGRKFTENNPSNGEKWSGWLAASMSLAAFVVTILLWSALRADHHAHVVHLFDWISVGLGEDRFYIPWALHIDTLSVTMLLIITGVGSLIHIYAIGYMHGDKDFSRFFTYLNLFMFFMILLVTGSSYLTLFVGWEGVGLASFLLIGFWFDKSRIVEDKDRNEKFSEGVVNANSGRKAFVANRFGDLCMILAMSLIFWTFGTMEFGTSDHAGVFQMAVEMYEHGDIVTIAGQQFTLGGILTAIVALLLLGATGKSAQIPFFTWLPDAMAGPTPVSALMHAATMVTSGIYLLVRSNVLIEIVRDSHVAIWGIISSPDLIAVIGATTAVYAGLIAFTQFDIKKVLAYSTVSQLGFMIAAVGMGAYVAGMFHLITHAFFKGLLFMGAGSVIHGMEHGEHHLHDHHGSHDDHGHEGSHDESHNVATDDHKGKLPFDPQDMRFMGNLRKHMPITFIVYMVGTLALAGIFPFAGFWSKDEILAHATVNGDVSWAFTYVRIMLTIGAICTAFYMGRQIKMVFFGKERHEATHYAEESAPVMWRPLVVLAALALLGGAINIPYFSAEAAAAASGHSETAMVEDSHAAEDTHAEDVVDDHVEEVDSHAAEDTHAAEEEHASGGVQLALEHWLEHSIESFHLTDEGIVHMPHTPINLQYDVAILSTILAVGSLAASFFFVYGGNKPEKAEDKDPIFRIPPFPLMAKLPINSLYMKGLMPLFNRIADFAAFTIDWNFYHDTFHDSGLRANFIRFGNWLGSFDRRAVDGGMVMGMTRLIRGISGAFQQLQTGYVRNYALSLFIGVVALILYFVIM